MKSNSNGIEIARFRKLDWHLVTRYLLIVLLA